jgi:oligoendopeptidase F
MSVTTTPDIQVPPRRFVPEDFDPGNLEALAGLVETIAGRPVASGSELEDWIRDWSELESFVMAGLARRYIAKTCNTADKKADEAYLKYELTVVPAWRSHDDRLNHVYLASPHKDELADEFRVFRMRKKRKAKIFREENNPLLARDAELGAKYNDIQGAITVDFRGETLTSQQCAANMYEQDRETRAEAFGALWKRRLQDRDALEGLFEEQLVIRHEIACNAGFENYRDYRFAELLRFDYRPEDCVAFHDAVEEVVVPAARELADERKKKLGIDSLRFYDTFVGLSGRPPIIPFKDEAGYLDVSRKLFNAVDPVFEKDFEILVRNGLLDLMSRQGKAPGGYNYPVEDMRLPFIFINAVGRHSDIQTMLHEGGHAFHTLACRDKEVLDFRDPPMEFCEVASMAMEMLALERFDRAYGADDARDAAISHLDDVVTLFPWIATIDAFQHWLYTHPGHSREERKEKWIETRMRFTPYMDWTGDEEVLAHEWQRQGHLYGAAFYYIEYAIAQIGALQVWRNERHDHDAAIAAYRKALGLGGTRSLAELFDVAGGRFAMDRSVLGEVIPDVMGKIRELSA